MNIQKRTLIHSKSGEFLKKFNLIANKKSDSLVKCIDNLDTFLTILYFEKYPFIYVDLRFNKFDKVLSYIKGGRNKQSEVYFVFSGEKYRTVKRKEINLPKKFSLWYYDGKNVFTEEGEQIFLSKNYKREK